MFPIGTVSTVSSNQEQTFGLQPHLGKRVMVCPDIKEDFGKVIERTTLQSIISGESVSVPRKNKVALMIPRWSTHILMAGNYFPSFIDKGGSIARRFVIFPCVTVVKNRDTTLAQRIVADELPTVLLRCLERYYHLKTLHSRAGFWESIAPQALIDVKEELTAVTNPLANFIKNGDSYWDVIATSNKNDVVRYDDFRDAFEKHMRYAKKARDYKMGSDEQPIKAAGFTITKTWMCKVCGKKSSAQICGDHYVGARNRRRLKSITHMKLVAKEQESNF